MPKVRSFTINQREKLGYTEHAGTISVVSCGDIVPAVDWDSVLKKERTPLTSLTTLQYVAEIYNLHAFAIKGCLEQHTDYVAESQMTSGIILKCGPDLQLNAGGKLIKVEAGDQFILNPHANHGAETNELLIFAVIDECRTMHPSAQESRKIFDSKLAEIARDFPL